ncbi:MAG: hypothetical protein Kow00122_14210 [Thermoleophilia bacterium]
MSSVSIIGAGNMAAAIAGIAAKSGVAVQILARDPDKAVAVASSVGASAGRVGDPLTGEIVVLAVPYSAVAELTATYRDELSGRIVVDITNPVDPATWDSLLVPADSSAAGQIAEVIPDARVLKAFNTTFAGTLAAGRVGGKPTTVLVAGDDPEAKSTLIDIVNSSGLRALDAGPLARARELEAIGFMQIKLAAAGAVGWSGGFAVVQ